MSSLGDLLLGPNERSPNKRENDNISKKGEESKFADTKHNLPPAHKKIKREENDTKMASNEDSMPIKIESERDSQPSRIFPERIEKTDKLDAESNASEEYDDYVSELLNPDDRPRNVWHVVEGSKKSSSDKSETRQSDEDSQRAISPSHDVRSVYPSSKPSYIKSEVGQAHHDISPGTDKPDYPDRKHYDSGRADVKLDRVDESHGRESSRRNHRQGDRNSDKERVRGRDRDREHKKGRDDVRTRDREHEKGRDDERSRDRDKERDRRHGRHRSSRDKDRDYHRTDKPRRSHRKHNDSDYDENYDNGDRHRRGTHSRQRRRSRSNSLSRKRERSNSNSYSPSTKRNSRTILIQQLSPQISSHDLEEFFTKVGKVREVRLITDSKTRRHKGIAYIEFEDASTATKALNMNGQKLFGVQMVIQSVFSDRNKGDGHHGSSQLSNPVSSHSTSRSNLSSNGYRVYVGGLHPLITEDMLRTVLEPFGHLSKLEIIKERSTGTSRGYGFTTYSNIEDGQEAVRCLDGFELAGKNLRVSKSTDPNFH